MGDAAEEVAFPNPSRRQPFIDGRLDPIRYRHREYMATVSEQVNDGPVFVALLKMRYLQAGKLGTSQVDGRRGKSSSLQLIAVPKNDGATERQSGLGAVPSDEVVYGIGIGPLRGDRTEALQN
jgi:hypothetical protein